MLLCSDVAWHGSQEFSRQAKHLPMQWLVEKVLLLVSVDICHLSEGVNLCYVYPPSQRRCLSLT